MEKDDNGFKVLQFLEKNKEIWEDMFIPCPFQNKINSKCIKDFNKVHNAAFKRFVNPLKLTPANSVVEQSNNKMF